MSSSSAVPNSKEDFVEEFRKETEKNPALEPLYNIFQSYQKEGGISNLDLFAALWAFVHSDKELSAIYKQKVDPDLDAVASTLGLLSKDRSETGISTVFEDTGRISAPKQASELDSVEKKPSFIYQDFFNLVSARGKESPDVKEKNGKPMVYIPNQEFQNWGLTVKNTPSYTFIAKTRVGVQNLIKWAAKPEVNKRVRVAGFRHTWGDFYAADGEIIVILLPLLTTISLPSILVVDKNSDLQGITVFEKDGQNYARIAAGTTNDQFRQWCYDKRTVALPLNVIMIEITYGGSNAPVCHGAGITTSTLSDLVAEVEYVDPKGEIRTVSDPAELRAASGCFGLLGVVLSITLRVDKMQKALLTPQKVPVALAIPPPPNYDVPAWIDMSQYSQQQLDEAQKKFEETVEKQYYVEWFWFPFQDNVWVNVWTRADITTAQWLDPYPSNFQAALQWLEGFFAEVINNWAPFQRLPGWLQAFIFGTIGMLQMPDVPDTNHPITTYVSEALHFRRGIQNMRCLDSEWEIPIPAPKPGSGKPRDYTVIQRAWWDGITSFYNNLATCPMRVTLEMRLTGSSNVIMAPQQHNDYGTCSIEVLTTLNPTEQEWKDYKQQVVDMWSKYTDASGKPLNIRPHWAKEWQGLNVRNKDVIKYLQEDAYPNEIKEFVDTLSSITSKRGSSLAESRQRFSNPLLEQLIFKT